MATTKTLTPTNQAITLAAFTEKPDNRTNVTNDDKLADAVNALNSNVMTVIQGSNGSIDYFKVGKIVFVKINAVELTERNKWITVGVLPAGYRPASVVNFLCYDNTVVSQTVAYTAIESRCASDGAVTVWPYRENSKPTGSFMFVLT